jgi:hypothetical protein
MQPGQFLVNKYGEKCKVLGVCGEAIFKSYTNNFDTADPSTYTLAELKKFGWSLIEEPWVPSLSEPYWFLDSDGGHSCSNWGIDGMEQHNFRLSIGNVYKVENDLELYKQKLIERMGKK